MALQGDATQRERSSGLGLCLSLSGRDGWEKPPQLPNFSGRGGNQLGGGSASIKVLPAVGIGGQVIRIHELPLHP